MTAQTVTIADFLLARYDEDEEAAEKWSRESTSECWNCGGNTLPHAPDALSPARVLAEAEAKRKIVEAWPDTFGLWSADQADAARAMKDVALRALALPYADHSDWREEWRA